MTKTPAERDEYHARQASALSDERVTSELAYWTRSGLRLGRVQRSWADAVIAESIKRNNKGKST